MKNMSDYQKKLADAPYHPGYEDAVITESKPVLYGIYKSKPLDMEQIVMCAREAYGFTELNKEDLKFVRAIEERHGIK
jgi:hypothetical protein